MSPLAHGQIKISCSQFALALRSHSALTPCAHALRSHCALSPCAHSARSRLKRRGRARHASCGAPAVPARPHPRPESPTTPISGAFDTRTVDASNAVADRRPPDRATAGEERGFTVTTGAAFHRRSARPHPVVSRATRPSNHDRLDASTRSSPLSSTTHHAPRTTHHAPRTTHHAPRTTHHAPRTTHHAPPTTHHPRHTTHDARRTTPPAPPTNRA
jgi:hypothetical protein